MVSLSEMAAEEESGERPQGRGGEEGRRRKPSSERSILNPPAPRSQQLTFSLSQPSAAIQPGVLQGRGASGRRGSVPHRSPSSSSTTHVGRRATRRATTPSLAGTRTFFLSPVHFRSTPHRSPLSSYSTSHLVLVGGQAVRPPRPEPRRKDRKTTSHGFFRVVQT